MDEAARRALAELEHIGSSVLWRFGKKDLLRSVRYRLNGRYVRVLGSCETTEDGSAIISVQYPLWNMLTDAEKMHLSAHEHAHFVTWWLYGGVPAHGGEWKDAMAFLGYPNASASTDLNRSAVAHLNRRRTMAERVTLWVKDGYIFMKSPFHERFIQEFKADIPGSMRSWMGNDKVWRIAASYHDDLLSVVRKYFGEPTVVEPEPQIVIQGSTAPDGFSRMLRAAPNDVLKKVYRLIAAEIHPDKGGKPETMVELNEAWSEVKKERGI